MTYNELSRQELIGYLMDFVEGLERHELDADEQGFVELHKKIIWELAHDRIYKVSTARASSLSESGVIEYDIQYFSSLSAAKRELRERMEKQRKHPYLAGPDEVQEHIVQGSLVPDLIKSVVSNTDLPIEAPGRFKFYEVRMLRNGNIVPVQFVLTDVHITPSVLESPSKNSRKSKNGKVIPFESILR